MVAALATSDALAQAWVPPRGVGSVSLTTQRISNTGHRRSNGFLDERGQSIDVALYLEGEYAFTDRLSIAAGLPYVFAKYVATTTPAPPIPYPPVDKCHCWNSGWQDLGFNARYNVLGGAFALTPSLSVGVPSRGYDYQGEAVVGRNLKELRIGIDAGQRLDAISPKLSVQGRYSYAFVERVIDIPNNRSNASVEGAFLLDSETGHARMGVLAAHARWTAFRIAAAGDSSLSPRRSQHPGAFGAARPPSARQLLARRRRPLLLVLTDGRVRLLHRVRRRYGYAPPAARSRRRQPAIRARRRSPCRPAPAVP